MQQCNSATMGPLDISTLVHSAEKLSESVGELDLYAPADKVSDPNSFQSA